MAELKNQIKTELTAAMKARDDAAKSSLRMALAAITNEEVSGQMSRELSFAEEQAVIAKEVHKREDAAQTYAEAGRSELAQKEAGEAAFLSRFLPAALSEDELEALVAQEIAETEAELGMRPTLKNMGAIVRSITTKTAGRSDGKTVAALVKRALD